MHNERLHAFPEPVPAVERRSFPWVNILLFLATGLTTLTVGTFLALGFESQTAAIDTGLPAALWQRSSILLRGLPFSAALLAILLAHEMGHYLPCRYYGISATLPYFIPAPTLVGTFGAFFRIRSPIQHRS